MTVLLLDADITIYKSAFANEVATETNDGYWTWYCDINKVKDSIDSFIAEMLDTLNADSYKLCLSDNSDNFRKRILPSYKEQRQRVKRPLVLKPIREWLINERGAIFKPSLEGDDIVSIYSTSIPDSIIVSADKDMLGTPGKFYQNATKGVVTVTEEEADYFHLYQTLIGDPTDGYKGLEGCGPVAAKKLLDEAPTWLTVKTAYEKKGLTEEDALVQARCARILRVTDYDFEKKEPILWTPLLNDSNRFQSNQK